MLTAKSQISFVSLDFRIEKPFDVVFFASPRSAEYFFMRQPPPPRSKCACVGPGTAAFLERKGISVAFSGTAPGNPLQNSKDFAFWLGSRRVLFPQSNLGTDSMRQFIPEEQVECVQVYNTEIQSESIALHDLYIFTSPSNVEGFLLKNSVPTGEIMAWGQSTKKALVTDKIPVSYTLKSSHENEVIEYLRNHRN